MEGEKSGVVLRIEMLVRTVIKQCLWPCDAQSKGQSFSTFGSHHRKDGDYMGPDEIT